MNPVLFASKSQDRTTFIGYRKARQRTNRLQICRRQGPIQSFQRKKDLFFFPRLSSDVYKRQSSTRTDLDHPFVRRAILMGKEPFGSPTLSDQALMRFPSVKIGPGNSARSHSADEYIKGPEIREAIDTYVRLLNGLQL